MADPATTIRQPLTFSEVYDLYKQRRDRPTFKGMDLPTFAARANELTGTEHFSAGLHPSKLKEASIAFDELLAKTGVPQATGSVFKSIAEEVAPRFTTQAEKIGEGLPRSLLEFGGVALAASTSPLALPVGIPLAGLGMLSAGAKAYTDTDSVVAGLISAATVPLMPGAGNLGAKLVAKGVTQRLAAAGANAAARAIETGGAMVGQSALAEAANQASSLAVNHSLYNPFSAENLFQHLANQLAFAPLTAYHLMKTPTGALSIGDAMNKAVLEAANRAKAIAETERQKYWAQQSKPMAASELAVGDTELGKVMSERYVLPKPEPTAENVAGLAARPMRPTTPQTLEEAPLSEWGRNWEQTFLGKPVYNPIPDVRLPAVGEARAPLKTFTPPIAVNKEGPLFGAEPMDLAKGIMWSEPSAEEPKRQIVKRYGEKEQPQKPGVASAPPPVTPPGETKETGGIPPSPTAAKPAEPTKAELIAKATKAIEDGIATKSPEGTKVVGELLNKITEQPKVTDAVVNKQMQQHLDEGKTPVEAVKRVQQTIENKLNMTVGEYLAREKAIAAMVKQSNDLLAASMAAMTKGDHKSALEFAKQAHAIAKNAAKQGALLTERVKEGPQNEQVQKQGETQEAVDPTSAIARLAALPEPVADFLGKGIAKVSSRSSHEAASDVISDNIYTAALAWWDQNKTADLSKPETAASLEKWLSKSAVHGEAAFAKEQTKQGVVRGIEEPVDTEPAQQVELPLPKAAEATSDRMKEAVQSEQEAAMPSFIEAVGDLISGKNPFTKEEAVAAGLEDTSDKYLTRLNAVAKEIALGATFGTATGTTKKGFNIKVSDELAKVFGTKAASVQDFVKKNIGAIRKLIDQRMGRLGHESIENALGSSEKTLLEVRSFFLDKPQGEHGAAGGLPAATRSLMEQYFRAAGHSPAEAGVFADMTMRVAAAFKMVDLVRIGDLVEHYAGDKSLGTSVTGKTHELDASGRPRESFTTIVVNAVSKLPMGKPILAMLKGLVIGHEVWHAAWENTPENDPRYARLQALHKVLDSIDPDIRVKLLDAVRLAMVPGGLPQSQMDEFTGLIRYSARSAEEFIATYAGFIGLGAGAGSGIHAANIRELITLMPKQMADMAIGMYVDIREISGALTDIAVNAGVHRGVAKSFYDLMNDHVSMLLKSREEIQRSVDTLTFLRERFPTGWDMLVERSSAGRVKILEVLTEDSIQRAATKGLEIETEVVNDLLGFGKKSKETEKLGIEEKYRGKLPNFFEKNVMIPAHLREIYPELGAVEDVLFNFRGKASNELTKALAPFGTVNKVGHVGFGADAPIVKVGGSKKLEEAASEIMLAANKLHRELKPDEFMTMDRFPKLTEDERTVVTDYIRQKTEAMSIMADVSDRFQRKDIGDSLAAVMIYTGGMRSKAGIERGEAITTALMAVKEAGQDAVKVAAAVKAAETLMADLDPEVSARVLQNFEELHKSYAQVRAKFESQRGWYSPETRLGKFYISYRVKGEKQAHFVGIEDRAEARIRLTKLEADSTVEPDSIALYDKFQQQKDVNTLYTDIINQFGQIEEKAFKLALAEAEKVSPEAANTMARLFHPKESVFREVTLRGFAKHFGERKLVPGREEINMPQGVVAYVKGMTLGLSKQLTKRRAALLLADQEMQDNPQLRQLARDHVVSVVDAGEEWSRLKAAAFHMYLGSNLSSLVIESFQPLFSLVPELTRQGTGWVGSFKTMGTALDALFKINVNKGHTLPPEWRVGEALRTAEEQQAIGLGMFQEVEGVDADTTVANLRQASISSEDLLTPRNLVMKPLYWWGHFTKGLYRGRTAFNDRVAFLSGYLDGINRQKLSFDDAVNYGIKVKNASMFSGGAAARPIGMFANKGELYGAVGALYCLRHYSTSMVSNFYRMAHDSLGSSGLPKTEMVAARKALGHMVSVQVLLSGALGLPFASGMLSVLEQMFPDAELKKHLREGLASLAGDDEKMGGVISDMALRGVTTAFTPVDLSARFGLGDVFGLDPNRGFSAATVFGVPGSLFERAAKGFQSTASGDFTEASRQFLPNAFSSIIKMYHDDFKLRDKAGNLIYDPNGAEVLLAATGFRPRALAQARESQAMMTRTDEIHKRELAQFHDEAARVLMRGHPELVRRMLLERATVDETFSVYGSIRSIVDSALDQSYPRELGRSGIRAGMTSREEIARTFPGQPQPLSETERVLQGAQLAQTLGVAGVGRVSRTQLRDAQMVDFLRQQNPALSRQHALLMLERLRGGEVRRTKSIGQLY